MAPLLYGLHLAHRRLRRILEQLEQERAEVHTIFEHMADSVLVLDANDQIMLSNPGAARMLGRARLDGLGLASVGDPEGDLARRAHASPVTHLISAPTRRAALGAGH